MKEIILGYLQKNGLDIYSQYHLISAEFADNPPRLLFKTNHELKLSEIDYEGTKIPVEVVVTKEEGPKASGNPSIDAWKKRHNIGDGSAEIPEKIVELPNPQDAKSENLSSYDAWKKRHNLKTVR